MIRRIYPARRRRVLRFWGPFAAAACAAVVIAPTASGASGQRVGSYVVHWPDRTTLNRLAPQDVVRVSLSHRGHAAVAVVSLVRVARTGTVMGPVATHRFRSSGTFVATLPTRGGRYRVVVTSGGVRTSRTFAVAAPAQAPISTIAPTPSVVAQPCSDGSAVQASLATDVASAHAGQTISVTLSDTGTSCLQASYEITWETLSGGTWVQIPLNRQWPAAIQFVYPGAPFVDQFKIPDDAIAGTYRLGKTVDTGAAPSMVTTEITIA